ncbi:hypothetical protein [Rhodococcus sp. NPDC058521]
MTAGILFSIGLAVFVAALLHPGSDLDFTGRSVHATCKARSHPGRRRVRY